MSESIPSPETASSNVTEVSDNWIAELAEKGKKWWVTGSLTAAGSTIAVEGGSQLVSSATQILQSGLSSEQALMTLSGALLLTGGLKAVQIFWQRGFAGAKGKQGGDSQ